MKNLLLIGALLSSLILAGCSGGDTSNNSVAGDAAAIAKKGAGTEPGAPAPGQPSLGQMGSGGPAVAPKGIKH